MSIDRQACLSYFFSTMDRALTEQPNGHSYPLSFRYQSKIGLDHSLTDRVTIIILIVQKKAS